MLEESGIVVPIRGTDSASNFPIPRLASLGDRLIAVLLDTAILAVACALVDVWVFLHWGVIAGGELRSYFFAVGVNCGFHRCWSEPGYRDWFCLSLGSRSEPWQHAG